MGKSFHNEPRYVVCSKTGAERDKKFNTELQAVQFYSDNKSEYECIIITNWY